MKLSIIVGTRPEIIKMSSIIQKCKQEHIDYFILHTGQHYTYEMDQIFFDQLELPKPKYNLDVGSALHGEQTGKILTETEKVLQKEKPDVVLVQGDTNTVLAGSLAATKLHIKVGHVEAGLRSYDRNMPEEINRILSDHCSDYLFAPTEKSKKILLSEGIAEQKIFITGNTIVDALLQYAKFADRKSDILSELDLTKQKYFLVTVHRQENVDDKNRFNNILTALKKLSQQYNYQIIYPIHPRAQKKIHKFNLDIAGITLLDPVDFLSFIKLEKNAKIVLTDSGGVQEETCILGVPCVTLRDNTERPETIDVGSNILAGIKPDNIIKCVSTMNTENKTWKNPFGDGKSGETILKILQKVIS